MSSEFFLTNRRSFLAAGGAGAALLMSGFGEAHAAHHEEGEDKSKDYAAAEKANLKVVQDFCDAWETRDVDKIGSYLADDAQFRMIETAPRQEGKETIMGGMKTFLASATSAKFEVIRAHAMGNIVINDRIDYFVTPDRNMEFRIVGLFYVKDGKILEWQDYTMPG